MQYSAGVVTIPQGHSVTIESGVGSVTIDSAVLHLQDRTITPTATAVATGAVAFPFTVHGPETITVAASSLIITGNPTNGAISFVAA